MFNKIKRLVKDPKSFIGYAMIDNCPHLMSDKFYLSMLWKMKMGYELDWKHPKKFNEKLQWLKLNDRKPEYTIMVDKYRAKQWIAGKIGEQYVIPTLAVYNSADEIDLGKLPEQFVLKCNHDSGSVVICKNKFAFDLEAAKRMLGSAMKKNFFWEAREWPYKNVKPLIFAEKFLEGIDLKEAPADYKFYCFNGEPKLFYITSDKGGDLPTRQDFFDIYGRHMDLQDVNYPNNPTHVPELPNKLDDMLRVCHLLAKDTLHLRVDFYEIEGRVYCGELTFFENAGFCKFIPEKYNRILGDWIKLPIDEGFKQ